MDIRPTYASEICDIDKAYQQGIRACEDTVDVLPNPLSGVKATWHSLRANHSNILATVFERFRLVLFEAQKITPEHRKIIQKLLNQPMQMPNEELGIVLQLDDCMATWTAPKA